MKTSILASTYLSLHSLSSCTQCTLHYRPQYILTFTSAVVRKQDFILKIKDILSLIQKDPVEPHWNIPIVGWQWWWCGYCTICHVTSAEGQVLCRLAEAHGLFAGFHLWHKVGENYCIKTCLLGSFTVKKQIDYNVFRWKCSWYQLALAFRYMLAYLATIITQKHMVHYHHFLVRTEMNNLSSQKKKN